ncbi:MAG: LXG domain-containing protein [Streptococcaceae bacterium]|jgi:hypothetical protein|nr:LXG domain-containing protein [Streptococcaceae bacterium]
MGLKYSSSDSSQLISALSNNLRSAKSTVEQLKSGSQKLTQTIDGNSLSGAAYTAGKGLFKDLIIPTINRTTNAIDGVQRDLNRYESANQSISGEDFLDSDNLKQQIAVKKAMKKGLEETMKYYDSLTKIYPIASFIEEVFHFNKQLSKNIHNLEEKIKELEKKLKKLNDFKLRTNGLFNNGLNNLKIAMQSVLVLNGVVVNSDGSYRLPAGADKSWFTKIQKGKAVSEMEQIDAILNKKNPTVADMDKILEYAKKHLDSDIPQDMIDWLKKNSAKLSDSVGNYETVANFMEQLGLGIQKFGGLVTVLEGIKGPNNSFVMVNPNGFGQTVVNGGSKLANVGKYVGKGFMIAGFGLGMYDDMANNDKTFGQAVMHNGSALGFGAGASVLLLGSNPVGWAALGAIGVGVAAGALFNLAYDNNFLGMQDGLDFLGSKVDDGMKWPSKEADKKIKEVRQAIEGTVNAINPFNWAW